MKARNREINIFSLSLMDVISGAMGAFLIIMIILARYYVFDPEVTQDAEELRARLDAAVEGLARIKGGTEEIFADLIESDEGARTQSVDAGETVAKIEAMSRAIAEDVDRVTTHLAAVHAESSRLEAELQERAAELSRATKRIDALEFRNPLAVSAFWTCPENIDLFLESDRVFVATDKRGVEFDPRVRRMQQFAGDASSDSAAGPASELSIVSETPKETKYKIFVNILRPGAADADCRVVVHALGYDGYFALMPVARLTTDAPYDYLGALTVDADYKFDFREPSAEERRTELAAVADRVAKSPPPTN